MPVTARHAPRKSNCAKVSRFNPPFFCSISGGTAKKATMVNAAYITAVTQKTALQDATCMLTPAIKAPMAKPTGLPALKQAKAQFFRLEGLSYTAPSFPIAGGTAAAEETPSRPQNTSMNIALEAKPMMSRSMVKKPRLRRSNNRRPKRSATRPKKSRNAPADKVWAALIHVTSAAVILRSSPMYEVTQTMAPEKIELWPMAKVVVRTKRHSCKVFEKQAGR